MKLWLIGLSLAALTGALPGPLLARQTLKPGQSKCTCEKWGDALVNPHVGELCNEAGGVVETSVIKSVVNITTYYCVADSAAVRETFTDAACTSHYGNGYLAFCSDPVVCDPRVRPCNGGLGLTSYCYGGMMICTISSMISAPAGECYNACCGGGKSGDACYWPVPWGRV